MRKTCYNHTYNYFSVISTTVNESLMEYDGIHVIIVFFFGGTFSFNFDRHFLSLGCSWGRFMRRFRAAIWFYTWRSTIFNIDIILIRCCASFKVEQLKLKITTSNTFSKCWNIRLEMSRMYLILLYLHKYCVHIHLFDICSFFYPDI